MPDRGSRHRYRQDLCLSRAGTALRLARDRVDRHARAAGPALPPRPATRARCTRRADALGAAEGAQQLSVLAPDGARARRRAIRLARSRLATGADPRLGRTQRQRRCRRDRFRARGFAAVAAGDLDRRELPRQRVPVLVGLLRGQGAPAGAGSRSRRRQSPPAVCRSRAQARRFRRNPARCACVRAR